MRISKDALTFDDVLLQPDYSDVLPREVDLTTKLTNDITLNIPLVSAAMDTVTEASLAIALAQEGGMGIIHKNLTIRSKITTFEKIELHKNLALDYADLNYLDEAIGEAEKILALNRANEWALSHLIDFHKKKEDWEKASEILHQYQEVVKFQLQYYPLNFFSINL